MCEQVKRYQRVGLLSAPLRPSCSAPLAPSPVNGRRKGDQINRSQLRAHGHCTAFLLRGEVFVVPPISSRTDWFLAFEVRKQKARRKVTAYERQMSRRKAHWSLQRVGTHLPFVLIFLHAFSVAQGAGRSVGWGSPAGSGVDYLFEVSSEISRPLGRRLVRDDIRPQSRREGYPCAHGSSVGAEGRISALG